MILTASEPEPSQKRSRGNSRDTEGVGVSQRPQGKGGIFVKSMHTVISRDIPKVSTVLLPINSD